MAHVAMNTLIWEASVMLWVIGFVELGIGENDPKDFGWVLLSGALLETIALAFLIAAKDMFGATAAAAFILLLWALGSGILAGGNRIVQQHAVWWTGIYFLAAGIFLAVHGIVVVTIAFLLLVPVTWALALGGYTGNHTWSKIGGFLAAIDGIIFLIMAVASAIGYKLP